MEKRERRNRSRRPRDPPNRFDPPPVKTSVGNAADNKDAKKTVEEKSEKKVIDHTAIPDPHMFDNLKRETEEIAALKRPVVGGKRQIFSNWAKYETPMHDDADGDRSGMIGEDFEALLQQGGQKGGHFRFKSERGWDPESASLRSAILTLDLAALAEALTSIPLYERLDLPTDVFMAEEIERMDKQARERAAVFQVNQTKRTTRAKVEADKVSASILAKLLEREDVEEASVKVDLRADGDVQPLEFDMDNLGDAAATAQWDTASPEEPGLPPQVVMPELQARETAAGSREGSMRRSLSVEAPEPQEAPQEPLLTPNPAPAPAPAPTPAPTPVPASAPQVTKQLSPTPEPQSLVETTKTEPPAAARGEQGVKAEDGRRQGKRQKGKDRRSWASSDEGDADFFATKVEPRPPSEPATPPQPTQPVLQKQASPPLPLPPEPQPASQPVVQPVAPPEPARKVNVPEGGKRRKGQNQPMKPSEESTVKDTPAKALAAEPKERDPTPESELVKHPSKPAVVPAARSPAPHKAPVPVTKGKPGDDDQLDFLLSLRHPVKEEPVAFSAPSSTAVRATIDEEESVPAPAPKLVETKKEALEDWLDSMLDD